MLPDETEYQESQRLKIHISSLHHGEHFISTYLLEIKKGVNDIQFMEVFRKWRCLGPMKSHQFEIQYKVHGFYIDIYIYEPNCRDQNQNISSPSNNQLTGITRPQSALLHIINEK